MKLVLCAVGFTTLSACDERTYVRETEQTDDDRYDLTAAEDIASILLALPPWSLTSLEVPFLIADFDLPIAPVEMTPEVLATYERAAARVSAYTNTQIRSGYQLAFDEASNMGLEHLALHGPTFFIMSRLLLNLPDGIPNSSLPVDSILQFTLLESRALSAVHSQSMYALRGPVEFSSVGSLKSIEPCILLLPDLWHNLLNEFTWLSGAYPRRVFAVCEGRCGTYSASLPCQCDAACAGYNDCCTDIVLCD